MKNIIKTAAIILGTCFFAGKANAQMVSEQASQAANIVAEAKKTIVKEKAAPVADNKSTPAVTVSNNIETKAAAPVQTAEYKQPVVSMQGVEAVKPKSIN
jgi:outer membrane murein-binding lipoprotein Lpp